eukprot:scaffold131740_cov60-Phaeocystis_antarctica.AAC.3
MLRSFCKRGRDPSRIAVMDTVDFNRTTHQAPSDWALPAGVADSMASPTQASANINHTHSATASARNNEGDRRLGNRGYEAVAWCTPASLVLGGSVVSAREPGLLVGVAQRHQQGPGRDDAPGEGLHLRLEHLAPRELHERHASVHASGHLRSRRHNLRASKGSGEGPCVFRWTRWGKRSAQSGGAGA